MLGAGDLLARRVARTLVTSGHTVTVAGYHDEAHDSSGAPRRFIRLEDADALGSAVTGHGAVINLRPVISDPRSTLRALLDRPARRRRGDTSPGAAVLAALDAAPGIYNVADPAPSTNSQLNVLAAAITGQEALHPSYPSYSAADRDLLRRSHRLDVTAFRTATGWNPRLGPSALAFIPSA